jgi:hypothetical protein
VSDLLHPVVREVDLRALGFDERAVLYQQRVLRLFENPNEVLFLQALQLDADRETPLELGNQVRGLGDVERAGRDEQDAPDTVRPVIVATSSVVIWLPVAIS